MGTRVLKIAIIVFWIAMVGWFASREMTLNPAMAGGGQELLRDLGPEEGQEWFGVYLVGANDQKTKIGFAVTESEKRLKGHVLTSKSWMRLKVQGEPKTVRTETKILSDLDYQLINVTFVFSSDSIKFEVIGDVEGNVMRLEIITAAGSTQQNVTLDQPPLMPETVMARAVAEGLVVGKTFTLPVFDPTTFGYSSAEVRVVKSETNDQNKTFWLLTSTLKGLQTETWIDQEGRVIWQKAINFMTIRETKKQALNDGWSGAGLEDDIIDRTRVRVTGIIDRPRKTTRAILRIQGVDFSSLALDGQRQAFDPDSGRVVITREAVVPADSYTLPADPERFAKDLEATPTIQVKDAMIVRKKSEIVGHQTDALAAARLVHDWVFDNLEKKPLVSIPSARDVLEIKRGDCNEHAALVTALARAAGIPTRIVVGVVYQNGAFYYHAWNKMWVGQWVEVDATFGQFPADATHLRLLEGDLDQQIELLRVIGKLKIDVESTES